MLQCTCIEFENSDDRRRVVVEWMLASVCNYRCSYCPPRLHDGRVRWLDVDIVLRFCERLVEHWEGRPLTFLFTGGEPTLYPALLRVAAHARDIGAQVAVLSNGSRSLTWWKAAVKCIDKAILSFHIEEANRKHFVALTAHLSREVPVQVNLMMVPGAFEECMEVAREIEVHAPNAVVLDKPILESWRHLTRYSKQEQAALRQASCAAVREELSAPDTVLKGNLRIRRSDGTSEIVTPTQLLLNAENHWTGWECSIGLETLFIRWDEVYRGVCGVGGVLGSVYDEIMFPEAPVRCDHKVCNCIGGIKATKRIHDLGPT